ncbi:MAG: hypothetical protein LUE99_02520 [Bacteroides sp.]|nr:hypothetical protein [Bacteroides sp.]
MPLGALPTLYVATNESGGATRKLLLVRYELVRSAFTAQSLGIVAGTYMGVGAVRRGQEATV